MRTQRSKQTRARHHDQWESEEKKRVYRLPAPGYGSSGKTPTFGHREHDRTGESSETKSIPVSDPGHEDIKTGKSRQRYSKPGAANSPLAHTGPYMLCCEGRSDA